MTRRIMFYCHHQELLNFLTACPTISTLYQTLQILQLVLNGCCSVAKSYLTLCDPIDCNKRLPCPSLSPEFAQSHIHWVGDAFQPSHPLSSPSPPALSLYSIRVLSNGLALHIGWPKYWSFSISPSNEYPGLVAFIIDWFDRLAIQGTLKNLLQYHNLKATILWHSAFFMVSLSNPYMSTGKSRALTGWIFVSKMMSLLFNMLSRVVITFLPRSKRLLISRLQSLSTVILETKKIKSVTTSTFPPSVCHEWWDQMPWS